MPAKNVRIGIIGDYNPSKPSHVGTDAALVHSAHRLLISVRAEWVATKLLAEDGLEKRLQPYDGLVISPGSPYQSLEGAVNAIRWARIGKTALIATCGGFQHVVIEYARNILGYPDAQHAEYDPSASTVFISPLACDLAGRELLVEISHDSLAFKAYKSDSAKEQYQCNFGINPTYRALLEEGGLRTTGVESGEEESLGEPRILELPGHPFFVATLFVPQMRSTETAPHPLIDEFLRACDSASAGFEGG